MKEDFDIISHHFERDNIRIYGIFDVHLGAAEYLERPFIEFRDGILKDPNAYVVIGGDLCNNATRSSVSNIFEETMRPREQKRLMTEILRPLVDEGRILCYVSGNHERRSGKDADDDMSYDICAKLDIEDLYRPNMAFVKLQFGKQRGDGARNPTYRLFVTHGAGGGLLTGGAVNRAERYSGIIDGVDLVMIGHTHKPFVTAPSKLVFDPYNNRVTVKPFRVVSMAPWLAYGGYAAQKMLLPSSTAADIPQIITLHGKRKKIEVTM